MKALIARLLSKRAVLVALVAAAVGPGVCLYLSSAKHWYGNVIRDLLHRPPVQADFDGVPAFAQRRAAVRRLYESEEHRAKVLEDYYAWYFGRAVDDAGREYWLYDLSRNNSFERVQAQLLGSAEFYFHASGTDQRAVGGMISVLFGVDELQIPPRVLQAWLNLAAAGYSRSDIAFMLISSDRYRTRWLVRRMHELTGHSADAAEIAPLLQAMRDGQPPRAAEIGLFDTAWYRWRELLRPVCRVAQWIRAAVTRSPTIPPVSPADLPLPVVDTTAVDIDASPEAPSLPHPPTYRELRDAGRAPSAPVVRRAPAGEFRVAGRVLNGDPQVSAELRRWGALPAEVAWSVPVRADVNNDGSDDLVVLRSGTGEIWVLLSDHSGAFIPMLWGSFPAYGGRRWVDPRVGDFSGDGILDIAVRDAVHGELWVGVSDESLQWTGAKWGEIPAARWTNVLVGDFTGDGRDDLAFINGTDGTVWVAFAYGSHAFVANSWIPLPPSADTSAAVYDLNRDGRDDLALLSGLGTGRFLFARSNHDLIPIQWISDPELEDGTAPSRSRSLRYPVFGMLNHDRYGDALVLDSRRGTWRAFMGRADGTAAEQPWADAFPVPPDAEAVAGDFNGDGLTDLAFCRATGGGVTVLFSDENAGMRREIAGNVSSDEDLAECVAADLNGDGIDDLVARSRKSGALWAWRFGLQQGVGGVTVAVQGEGPEREIVTDKNGRFVADGIQGPSVTIRPRAQSGSFVPVTVSTVPNRQRAVNLVFRRTHPAAAGSAVQSGRSP